MTTASKHQQGIYSFYGGEHQPTSLLIERAETVVAAWDNFVPKSLEPAAESLVVRLGDNQRKLGSAATVTEKVFYGGWVAVEGAITLAIAAPALVRAGLAETRFRRQLLREFPDKFRPGNPNAKISSGLKPKVKTESLARQLVKATSKERK